MGLFRKFFYRKPPDGLLEISERVYGQYQSLIACILSEYDVTVMDYPRQYEERWQEIFSNVDWLSPKKDVANMVHHISVANIIQENLGTGSCKGRVRATVLHDDKVKEKPKLQASEHIITSPAFTALEKQSNFSFRPSLDANSTRKRFEPKEI
ncbi:hypothetical protein DITRI_Ditri10aG0136600 [Diplodiscus trichospermus]